MTKHIAIDARGYSTSTGRYVRKLIENLERLDGENSYSILLKSKDWGLYSPRAANFTKVRADFQEFSFAEQIGLRKLLNSLGVDLVHFTMPNQPVFYSGVAVTTIHDLTRLRFDNPNSNLRFYGLRKWIFGRVIKRVAHRSSFIITPSQFVKDDVTKFTNISPDKITVTYESADKITEPAKSVVKLVNKKYLLYVGQAYSHKNLQRLASAFSKIHLKHPDVRLVIAGRKTKSHVALDRWIRKQNIEGVMFVGFVSDSELRWLYENAECYVFPSVSEGFGLPGLEAMAHGCPVASSDATCLSEVYGEAALYFDPSGVDDITKKIQWVLDDKALRYQLITSGKNQLKKYSWKKMAGKTLEIYKYILT